VIGSAGADSAAGSSPLCGFAPAGWLKLSSPTSESWKNDQELTSQYRKKNLHLAVAMTFTSMGLLKVGFAAC
jgi:hypothetical protein